MAYVKVRGRFPGGKVTHTVSWRDGQWSAEWYLLPFIKALTAAPFVLLTPTGPAVPSDSARASVLIACEVFRPGDFSRGPGTAGRIVSLETDIPLELAPLPPGVVSGPRR